MKTAVFGAKSYEKRFFEGYSDKDPVSLEYLEPRLMPDTVPLAEGYDAVCVFVHDQVNRTVIERLAALKVRMIALRSAGFNNVDLEAAAAHGITVARVPAYSPAGVAEFAVTLVTALNRRIHNAYRRVRDGNFSLEGLMGFQIAGKTVGVVGTGKIGAAFAQIMLGFGCEVLGHDLYPQEQLVEKGVRYVPMEELLERSHIVSLHCPLTDDTRHLINGGSLRLMRDGAMLINTSRGELVETGSVINAVKSGKLGSLGIDVYENEEGVFFEDLSNTIVGDDELMRLTTFPNVIITSHQAFFTEEAMANIVAVTVENIKEFAREGTCANAVRPGG